MVHITEVRSSDTDDTDDHVGLSSRSTHQTVRKRQPQPQQPQPQNNDGKNGYDHVGDEDDDPNSNESEIDAKNEFHDGDDDDDDDDDEEVDDSDEGTDSDDSNDENSDDDDDDSERKTKRAQYSEKDQKEEMIRHLPIGERLQRQLEVGVAAVQHYNNNNNKDNRRAQPKQTSTQSQAVQLPPLATSSKQRNETPIDNPTTKITNGTRTLKSKKHAPTEMSSKRKDFYNRQRLDLQGGGVAAIGTNLQVHANLYKGRDPRSSTAIDTTASTTATSAYGGPFQKQRGGKQLLESIRGGNNNTSLYDDRHNDDYAFLQDMRNTEIRTLQKRIKARQLTGRKGQEHRKRYNVQQQVDGHDDGLEEDQKELHRLQQDKATFERRQLDIATKRAVQQTIRQEQHRKRQRIEVDSSTTTKSTTTATNKGQQQRPSQKYVPKVRELKRMYMETKYDLLSQQPGGKGKVEKMILKKHSKNKTKDSRKGLI
jgi:rRNA biogenesis protein RRP36